MIDAKGKYERALKVFSQPPSSAGKQLMVAICFTKLGHYPDAQQTYSASLRSALEDRLWHLSGQVNELVDALVLSNESSLFPRVLDEVEAYKLDPRGDALLPLYTSMLWPASYPARMRGQTTMYLGYSRNQKSKTLSQWAKQSGPSLSVIRRPLTPPLVPRCGHIGEGPNSERFVRRQRAFCAFPPCRYQG